MNAATHFPNLVLLVPPAPRRQPRFEPALLGAGSAAVVWLLLHAAFAFCWLTAGRV